MWVCEDKDIKKTYLENIIDTDVDIKLKVIKNSVFGNNNKGEQILMLAVWPPEVCCFT